MSFQIPGGDSWGKLNQVKAPHQANADGGGTGASGYQAPLEEKEEKFDELELSTKNVNDEFEIVVDCTIFDIIKNFFMNIYKNLKKVFVKN